MVFTINFPTVLVATTLLLLQGLPSSASNLMATSHSDISAIIAEKKALRAVFKSKRQAMGSDRIHHIASINQSLSKLITGLKRPTVAGYYPVGDEISVIDSLQTAQNYGYETGLPVVVKASMPLVFRSWKFGDDLVAGAFNIPEPRTDKASIVPNFVIVPLLAFDALGYRLGYGGGFYDRTLALLKQANPQMIAVGVAYAMQKSPDLLPIDGYDQRLNYIITEQETLRFA